MKRNSVLAAMACLVLVLFAVPQVIRAERAGIEVIATAYTCEAHPNNPMHPCGRPRWGGNPYGPGLACPSHWRNQYMEVPGYGILRCDDTGWYETWNGYPHIDIRVSTYAEAYGMGFRKMVIYPVDGPPPNAAPKAADAAPVETTPTPASSPEQAVQLAHKVAPKGDTATAIARLMPMAKAWKYFPDLLNGVSVEPEQPVWLVSIWVPDTVIPEGTVARPDASKPIAARFFIFEAESNALLLDTYVSSNVVETMGWLTSDTNILAP